VNLQPRQKKTYRIGFGESNLRGGGGGGPRAPLKWPGKERGRDSEILVQLVGEEPETKAAFPVSQGEREGIGPRKDATDQRTTSRGRTPILPTGDTLGAKGKD